MKKTPTGHFDDVYLKNNYNIWGGYKNYSRYSGYRLIPVPERNYSHHGELMKSPFSFFEIHSSKWHIGNLLFSVGNVNLIYLS